MKTPRLHGQARPVLCSPTHSGLSSLVPSNTKSDGQWVCKHLTPTRRCPKASLLVRSLAVAVALVWLVPEAAAQYRYPISSSSSSSSSSLSSAEPVAIANSNPQNPLTHLANSPALDPNRPPAVLLADSKLNYEQALGEQQSKQPDGQKETEQAMNPTEVLVDDVAILDPLFELDNDSLGQDAEEVNKRAKWSELQGGWGKRAKWNEFQGGWGKRAKWSELQGGWGKRAKWNEFQGGWGKRAKWNSLQGGWGKRAKWSELQGGWGKRAPNSWNKLSAAWGKRRAPIGANEWNNMSGMWGKKRAKWNELSGMWGKRAWKDMSGGWGKRAWRDMNGGWGKRLSLAGQRNAPETPGPTGTSCVECGASEAH